MRSFCTYPKKAATQKFNRSCVSLSPNCSMILKPQVSFKADPSLRVYLLRFTTDGIMARPAHPSAGVVYASSKIGPRNDFTRGPAACVSNRLRGLVLLLYFVRKMSAREVQATSNATTGVAVFCLAFLLRHTSQVDLDLLLPPATGTTVMAGGAAGAAGSGGTRGGKRGGETGAPPSFLDKLCTILGKPGLSEHISWNQVRLYEVLRMSEGFASRRTTARTRVDT